MFTYAFISVVFLVYLSFPELLLMLMLPVGTVWVLGLFLLILITFAKAGTRRLPSFSTI